MLHCEAIFVVRCSELLLSAVVGLKVSIYVYGMWGQMMCQVHMCVCLSVCVWCGVI